MIATAPGKLILTGEYAVLDGAPALVVAVDRRVVARRATGAASSPVLAALAAELAARGRTDAAAAALAIAVDSSALYEGDVKLGLGSSAAVTVAAAALALGSTDTTEILAIASAAHAAAQAPRGSRGSGADVAAAVLGGTLAFTAGRAERRSWPAGVMLIPFFTGASADTPSLVARVAAAASPATDAALGAIAEASRAACAAAAAHDRRLAATGVLAALALAAAAMDRLAAATRLPLVPPCVTAARARLATLGGTAKTTGAGGGDVAIAAIPVGEDATAARRYLIEVGCTPLTIAVDATGVDLRPDAQ